MNIRKLEAEAKKQRRWGYVQKAVLASVAITGILFVATVAPNALRLLGKPLKNKYRFANQTKSALSILARKGHITFSKKEGKTFARITPSGKQALAFEEQKMLLRRKSSFRWNKRWRVIIFDIPEVRRGTRAKLRHAMQDAGFYRLQDSVWIFPHDCEDYIVLLKAQLKLGNAVIYMIVETIENDAPLKKHFGLK